MKLAILYILIVGLTLTGMSCVYQLYPIEYSAEDTAFAKQYAAEMLELIEVMQQQSKELDEKTRPTACDYFLDAQDRFYQEKHAAVHYKREIAEDFVYAFAIAEDWCRYASRAAYDPSDTASCQLAQERLRQTRREFRAIANKDYVQ